MTNHKFGGRDSIILQNQMQGSVAVVTGAGSGIGEALARRVAALGMKVVLADVAFERVERVSEEISGQGGIAHPAQVDVADPHSIERLAHNTIQAFGPVRLLINNAGIETVGLTWGLSLEQWEKALLVNLHGPIHGVRAFMPSMLASGETCYITNVASAGALAMMPLQAAYIASKHALLSFSECLYLEMEMVSAPVHISVVFPGPVSTSIFLDVKRAAGRAERHRRLMVEKLVSDGMKPDEAASEIVKGIFNKNFWILTHPEITSAFAKERAAYLEAFQDPYLSTEMRGGLGID